jgi:hypothetical protein
MIFELETSLPQYKFLRTLAEVYLSFGTYAIPTVRWNIIHKRFYPQLLVLCLKKIKLSMPTYMDFR